MKINNNKGFTLIEVVVAMAVLAIVSGALLQMFVTSSKINRRAYETDKAQALSVKLLEEFKAAHDDTDIALFPELAGAVKTETVSEIKYEQYLDASWGTCSEASHVYKLEVVTSKPVVSNDGQMSFYKEEPVYSVEFDPASGGDFTLEVMNLGGDMTQLLFQLTYGVNASAIEYGNVKEGKVPVFVTTNSPLTVTRPFTIKNRAKLAMTDGVYDAAGIPANFELAVFFVNCEEDLLSLEHGGFEGWYSYSFIDASAVNTGFKTMKVKIHRRSDGEAIVQNEAGKYIVDSE